MRAQRAPFSLGLKASEGACETLNVQVIEGAIRFGLLLWEMLFRAVPYGDFSIAQPLAGEVFEPCACYRRIGLFLFFSVFKSVTRACPRGEENV